MADYEFASLEALDRPSVLDEVSTVLWYLETRLLDARAKAHDALLRAFEEEFGASTDTLRLRVPLRIGNWVGGDRDGNPFVTPEITIAAARRAGYVVLGRYRDALDELAHRLSLSARIAPPTEALRDSLGADREALPELWEANRKRNADEPVRPSPSIVRAARRFRLRASTGASVATTIMQEPLAVSSSSCR